MTSRTEAVANWMLTRSTRTALPVALMVFAAYNSLQTLLHPMVSAKETGTPAPKDLPGAVQAVTVELADPSFTDRLVAALPSLLQVALVVLAYSYLMWESRYDHYAKTRARRVMITVGIASILIILAPGFIGVITKFYFGIDVPSNQFDLGSVMSGGAFALLLVGAVGNRIKWVAEHERAKKLDAELENVV
jgi:hypothetical protein